MNEFLTFITTGTVESFEDKLKEKSLYLLKILYYTIALLFTFAVLYELALYLKWDSLDATIIGRINESMDKTELILKLIHFLLLPIITGFALWFSISKFNYERVCISLSLIISTVLYFIVAPLHVLPTIGHVGKYDLTPYLAFLIFSCLLYLIFSNIFTKKMIMELKGIWNNNLLVITYIYIVLFDLYMFRFIDFNWINIIACFVASSFIGFMLIYVRRLLGFSYTLVLQYIITLPFVGITTYMLINS